MNITLTEQAAKHIQASVAKRGEGLGLRLAVKPSGCSGLSYVVEFADQLGESDQVFEAFGARLVVDRKSLAFLDGTEVDYVRDGLNKRFEFRNPKVVGACGCGESFSVTG